MRRFIKISISLCLIIALEFLPLINSMVTYAKELSTDYNFITGVQLTDLQGNPLGDDIAKNSDLRLTYQYSIPNSGEVNEGDTFTLTIAEQIKIDAPGDFELYDQGGHLIGTGTIATDGTVVIVFTDYPENYSNISGSFWFDLYFDEDKIGTDDPTIITFEVGGTTPPFEISVDFEQPAPLPASIVKSGSYDINTKEITWTLTVNPENVTVRDAQVVDVISDGLDFVSGSVLINGEATSESDYTYSEGTLTYHFPEVITSQQVVQFRTSVKDTRFTTDNSHGTTIIEKNTATMNHEGTSVISNEAEVQVPINFISKTGTYNSVTKQIDWTIVVNQNGVSIPNAVVTDSLQGGLTLDSSSVFIDGEPSSSFTYNHPGITFSLGAISQRHTIKFSTDVESSAFISNTSKSYTNTAALTGEGVPGNATSGDSVGVPTNIIRKQGISYNAATGEITWRVTVNENKIEIQNAVVTDLIRKGQEYVEGSFTINNDADLGGFTYVPAAEGDEDKTGTLTYQFGAVIHETYVIEFKTKVTDPAVYSANANTTYRNEASIKGENIIESKSEGSQSVVSQVISKSGDGYDYVNRIVTWKIVVNRNQMQLNNAVFIDNIPIGMEYVAESASIDNGADNAGFSYTGADSNDPDKTGTLTYAFPEAINGQYTITFQTRITDLTIFQTNGDKSVTNAGTLKHDLVQDGVVSTGTQVIRNTVISKTGAYESGKKYIDWTININTNEIPLSDALITDQLQEGLALDTASVRLFGQSIDTNGNIIVGDEIELTADNVQYDLDERLFTFHLPSPASGGYRLTFRTNVVDKDKSPFTNKASFNGTGIMQFGGTEPITVSWSGSGSSGSGEIGSITVFKVDAEDNGIKLAGAEFELVDRYGNVVQRATTDTDGAVLFDMLRFDVPYTVKETMAPVGYNIGIEDYTFTIAGSDDVKDISYQYENTKIYGGIKFNKVGVNENPLAGAQFTLYDQDGGIVATAVSTQNGEVLFEHVPYGDYTIRETNPPEGYLPSDVELTASVRENNVTVTASPESVSNQIITGSIQLKKVGEDGETPLENAAFALYEEGDAEFAGPIATAITDADGMAYFEDIPYGTYIVKETEAPEGYTLSTIELTVDVDENAKTYDLGTISNTLIRGNIEILKTNIRGEALEGAKFALYDSEGNFIVEAESDPEGKAKFSDVPYGRYYIVETQAPRMYLESDEKIEAQIRTQDELLKFTVVNQRSDEYPWEDDITDTPDTVGNDTPNTIVNDTPNKVGDNIPDTGDSAFIMAWLLAGGSLLIGIAFLLERRIKSRK